MTRIADFFWCVFLFYWDCSVPFPPADDRFKRPRGLHRLCMTSEETVSPARERPACVFAAVCVFMCAAQIGRQAVLTRMWIVCARRDVAHGEKVTV